LAVSLRKPGAHPRAWLESHPYVLPFLILFAGVCFRFYNLNWDDGHQLHPDERGIYMRISGADGNPALAWPASFAQFFDVREPNGGSPLNPHFFAYGSLPFYLLAAIANVISLVGQHVPFLKSWAGAATYSNLPPVGRGLSALLDLVSVTLVFLLGRRLYGYWTGVLAMALCAFTVLNIQLSHFYEVDAVLLPLVLTVLLQAVAIAQDNQRRSYLLAGVGFGAAMATKTTALLLCIPIGVAAVSTTRFGREMPAGTPLSDRIKRHLQAIAPELNRNLQQTLIAFFLAAFVFAVCEPYALLDRAKLVSDIAQQQTWLVTNNPPFQVPFTIQYAHTVPYLYQLQNMLFWTLGVPLALAVWIGLIIVFVRNSLGRVHVGELVLLAWVIPYFLFVGRFFAKFNRYMLPITPILALFAAAVLVQLARSRLPRWRLTGRGLVAVVLTGSFLYSLAYMNIYEHPNTRVAASRWMFTHVPAGTVIANEGAWDDALPIDELGHVGSQYPALSLNMYDPDTSAKVDRIVSILTHARYIVMSSEKMDRSIPKVPDIYPMATRYYDLLLHNRLNFTLVQHFEEHPQLGPFVLQDFAADESFHVYDHPDVRIYQRTRNLTPARLRTMLVAGTPLAATASVVPAVDTRLMLSKKDWATNQQSPTYDQKFPPAGFPMRHPTLVWLLALEVLGLLTFPLTFRALPALFDRGYAAGKTLGLLILGYVIWIAVRLHLAPYDFSSIVILGLVLACGSLLLLVRLRPQMLAYVRAQWRSILVGEVVFLAAFALFVLLRKWYPDLQHQFSPVSPANSGGGRMGEKQMEFAFLNAIVRSRVFPPYDPFFAHGYINYYYYGLYLVGTLCKLTRIAPATGFNLAIATFFALLVVNVFTVAASLTRRLFAGFSAVLLTCLAGNLNGGVQLFQGLQSAAITHSSLPFVGGVINALSGLWQVIVVHQPLPPFDFWGPTRIIPSIGSVITEFPFFTFLFADLHAHLIAYPITALVLVVVANTVLQREAHGMGATSIVILALVLGALAVTNPWDYPTYILVAVFGIAIHALQRHHNQWWPALRDTGLRSALVVVSSAVLYVPFKHDYQTTFASGVGWIKNISSQQLIANNLCSAPPEPCGQYVHDSLVTPLHLYLEHFGLLLFVCLSYVAYVLANAPAVRDGATHIGRQMQVAWHYRSRIRRFAHAARVVRAQRGRGASAPDLSWLLGAAIVVAGLLALGDYLLAFLVVALGATLAAVYVGRQTMHTVQIFVLGLISLPLLLSIATQIVYVKDFLDGSPAFHMNTIFKFYDQAWLLLGTGAGIALQALFARLRAPALRTLRTRESNDVPAVSTSPAGFASSNVSLALSPKSGPQVPNALALFTRVAASIHPPRLSAPRHSRTGGSVAVDQHGVIHRGTSPVRQIWVAILTALLLGSFVYTYAGTVARETYRQLWLPESSVPFTLDGAAFMRTAYPEDYAAINWLNAHVRGTPVIAEAAHTDYNWRGRVTMFTGLPAIFNGIHEGEQRFSDEIDPSTLCASTPGTHCTQVQAREADVDVLYDSARISDAWRIIHRYGVRYIYVGFSEQQCIPSEQQCYSKAGLGKFDRMLGHGLRIAFRVGKTRIYEVTHA